MKRFLISLVLVLILWAVFERFPPNDDVKAIVVGVVGISYLFNWAQMLIFRRVWPMRSVGIFWTIFADSVYWCAVLLGFVFHDDLSWAVPLILAAFVVGAPALDLGTLRYLTRRTPPSAPRSDGLP